MSWDIEEVLENFLPDQNINWSSVVRKYNIPCRPDFERNCQIKWNQYQCLISKVSNLQAYMSATRWRNFNAMPPDCIIQTVKDEQKQLILSGQVSIGEACAPFSLKVYTNQ